MKLIITVAAQAPNEARARCRKAAVLEMDGKLDTTSLALACADLAGQVATAVGKTIPVAAADTPVPVAVPLERAEPMKPRIESPAEVEQTIGRQYKRGGRNRRGSSSE